MPELSRTQRFNKGSTLIEALIATLLVSVTLLSSMRGTTDAIATLNETLFYQRAIRITADLNELFAISDIPLANDFPLATTPDCTSTDICTPVEWLSQQFSALQTDASQLLPTGTLEINHATLQSTHTSTAKLRWLNRKGEYMEMSWQPAAPQVIEVLARND